MLPDRVSNPGPLTYESGALPIYINDANKEYIMWYVCKQFPQYLPLAQKAVRVLARMFLGKWLHTCYLCGDFILSQPEHLMLYYIKLNQFLETLWYKLTRGYQKVLSLRHFPHSDSTMLHT